MSGGPYCRKPRLKRLKNGPFLGALMAAISRGPVGWRDWFGQCAAIFARHSFSLEYRRASGQQKARAKAGGRASGQQKARAKAGLMLGYGSALRLTPSLPA